MTISKKSLSDFVEYVEFLNRFYITVTTTPHDCNIFSCVVVSAKIVGLDYDNEYSQRQETLL